MQMICSSEGSELKKEIKTNELPARDRFKKKKGIFPSNTSTFLPSRNARKRNERDVVRASACYVKLRGSRYILVIPISLTPLESSS